MTGTDKYHLGPAPADEACAQVGDEEYERRAKAECAAYIAAIQIVCGEPPPGAKLKVEWSDHDYGRYAEVVVLFDGNDREAAEYAARCDAQAPTTWAAAGLEAPEGGRGWSENEGVEAVGGTCRIRFRQGTVVATVGALHVATNDEIHHLLTRHLAGDWGDLDRDDRAANEHALRHDLRILSKYMVRGEPLYVITEADRSATTVLTPGEY